jgi:hypothetical protein
MLTPAHARQPWGGPCDQLGTHGHPASLPLCGLRHEGQWRPTAEKVCPAHLCADGSQSAKLPARRAGPEPRGTGQNPCRARCRLRTSSCPPGSSFARNRWCLPLGGLTARLCPRNHGTRRLTEGTTRRPILVTPAKAGVQPTSETRMCSRIGHNPHAHAVWIPAPDRVRGKLCAGMTESCRAGVLDRNDRVVPTGRRHRFLAGSGPVLACHLSHITCHGLLPNLLLARPAINADCLSSTSLGPPRDGNPAGSTPGNNLWLVAGGVLKRHPAGSVPVRA